MDNPVVASTKKMRRSCSAASRISMSKNKTNQMETAKKMRKSRSTDTLEPLKKQRGGSTAQRQRRSHGPHVSFGTVQVREYERIAGDNPCVPSGPSLGLGWGYVEKRPLSVRTYEFTRDRASILMPLNCKTRKFLLSFVFEVPAEDIKRSEQVALWVRAQRRETQKSLRRPKKVESKGVIEDPLPRKNTTASSSSNSNLLLKGARKLLLKPAYSRLQ